MRNLRNLFILLIVLSSLASATVVATYTSRPLWEAASSGITNVDFESLGLGVGGYTSYSNGTGLSTGGLTFVGVLDPNTFFLYALNPPLGADENFGSSTVLKGPELRATSYLNITLPAATTAFALDLMTVFPAAQSFRIQLDGIDVGIVITSQARPTRTFFGVTTDAPISQVTITVDSGILNQTQGLFDNFAYGSIGGAPDPPPGGGETPEVATMLSVGSGLVLLRWARRRQPSALTAA